MRKINLTPHAINLMVNGETEVIEPSGDIARVSMDSEQIAGGDIPICAVSFGEIENLPAPTEGTIFIVSSMVAQAALRPDVVAPHDLVRDSQGRIIGCKSFAVYM